jgi:hypothetical protein
MQLPSWIDFETTKWQRLTLAHTLHKTMNRPVLVFKAMLGDQVLMNALSVESLIELGQNDFSKRFTATSRRRQVGGGGLWPEYDTIGPGLRFGTV